MAKIDEFDSTYNSFLETIDVYFKNYVLPSDLYTKSFIDYYERAGSFLIKIFNLIPKKTATRFIEIYINLFITIRNNYDKPKNITQLLISQFDEFEKMLIEILEIESVSKLYYEEFSDISRLAGRVRKIILEINTTESERRALLKNIEEKVFNKQFEEAQKLREERDIALNNLRKSLLDESSKEFQDLSQKSKTDADEIAKLKTQLEFEIDEIKTRYKDDLSNFELIKQELIFTRAADWNRRSSYIWSGILAILLIILVIFSCLFISTCWKDYCNIFATYSKQPQEYLRTLFYSDLAKNIIIRLFLLSMLVFLIKYAMKHINALMHNHTINTHKANSLAAAMRIFSSINNETTREIVLTEAAKEIFTQQKTGYLMKEDGKLDINIIEKLSSILKK